MLKQKLFLKLVSIFMAFCVLGTTCYAEDVKNDDTASVSAEQETYKDNVVSKNMSTELNGKTINYKATFGTLVIENDIGVCEMSFLAYTKRGVKDKSKRPITFAFNGGPGSASAYLAMGSFGPLRVDRTKIGAGKTAQPQLEQNPYTILDMTDMVFVDPMGLGYSRALGDTDQKQYYSYTNDAKAMGDFIYKYLKQYDRLSSPDYIAGESYGTVRAFKVSQYLLDTYEIACDGVLEISPANDYSTLFQKYNTDLAYVNMFPSLAATAWYHKRIDKKYLDMKLEDFLEEVKTFTTEELINGIYKATRITDEEKRSLSDKMAGYIGLPADDIYSNFSFVGELLFRASLLADEGLFVGRYDSRYKAKIPDNVTDIYNADPSSVGVGEAYRDALVAFAKKLGFKTDKEYIVEDDGINLLWDFEAKNEFLAQEMFINGLMKQNPKMKVWVICGYYDLVTPFYNAEWIYSHLFLGDEELEKNISFTYYKAGHLFYYSTNALKKFRKDAKKWFTAK